MDKSSLCRIKHFSILCSSLLVFLVASFGLFANTALPELSYERLLTILSENGWRVELSTSNQVLLMPPGQAADNQNTAQEAGRWRIEKAQDGTIFLFFHNPSLNAANLNNKLKGSKTYTFEQLSELGERLIETGWKVEQRQGSLFLYPNSEAVVSADKDDSDNRIAILPAPQGELPSQFSSQAAPLPVQEVPAAATTAPEVAQPTASDSDGDDVEDLLDLCPETEADIAVNSLGCEKSKPLILEGVSFKSGSSTLTENSKEILDQYADILNKHPSQKINIVGHTDRTGSKRLNLELSKRRAESVGAYFVDREINKDRIDTEGQGESKPIASNETKKGRLKNRRVELNF